MSYSIKVTNTGNNKEWSMDFVDPKEYSLLEGFRTKRAGRTSVAILPAMLMPVRTNNLNNFVKDFFFPTLVNQALKINNFALKVFASFAAIIADIATSPFRILTVIPRCIHNHIHAKEKLPIYKYLKSKGADKDILKGDNLKIRLESKTVEASSPKEAESISRWYEWHIDLITTPWSKQDLQLPAFGWSTHTTTSDIEEDETLESEINMNGPQPKVDAPKKPLEPKDELIRLMDDSMKAYSAIMDEEIAPITCWEEGLNRLTERLESTVQSLLDKHMMFMRDENTIQAAVRDFFKKEENNPNNQEPPAFPSWDQDVIEAIDAVGAFNKNAKEYPQDPDKNLSVQRFNKLYGSDGKGIKSTLNKLQTAFNKISDVKVKFFEAVPIDAPIFSLFCQKQDHKDLGKELRAVNKMLENIDQILELKKKVEEEG